MLDPLSPAFATTDTNSAKAVVLAAVALRDSLADATPQIRGRAAARVERARLRLLEARLSWPAARGNAEFLADSLRKIAREIRGEL